MIYVSGELVETVRKVLTGEMLLEEVGHQDSLSKAYIGVTVMVACGYRVTPDGVVAGGLAGILSNVTQAGIQATDPQFVGGASILLYARKQGLHVSRRGMVGLRLILPPEMAELVCHEADRDALVRYMAQVDRDFVVQALPSKHSSCRRCNASVSQLILG